MPMMNWKLVRGRQEVIVSSQIQPCAVDEKHDKDVDGIRKTPPDS